MVIYPPVKFEFDGKKRWSPETEMLTDKRTKNGRTNGQNYTNFESNLAMMVIYLPVKFEFDFELESPERKMLMDRRTDIRHINLIGGLVTCNPPKNHQKKKK